MRSRLVPLSLPALLCALLGLAACGSDPSKADAGTQTDGLCQVSAAPSTCPSPAPVYADVQPIIQERCVGCHNDQPNAPWALNDYPHVADWQDAVAQMVADCEMPPADAGVPMTTEERAKILAWVQCGARP